jgi:hypothetical protein
MLVGFVFAMRPAKGEAVGDGIDERATDFPDRSAGRCAVATLDASMIGPLIRANLVQWEDDPDEAAKRRRPPGTIFTLINLGEHCLAEHEMRRGSID